ncbi:Imm59 family immunity protein [Streptococcus suis]|uniref:Imm59 family immunity protein n=1 Tax=Streptococcus suis TaxID=1307 RepID=UPI0030101780
MSVLLQQRQLLQEEIERRNYQTLRYSILGDKSLDEWQVRIDFNEDQQVYQVYATMDRASIRGKSEFNDFEEAKSKFIEKLDLTVKINRWKVEDGENPEYYSPLWSVSKPISLDTATIDSLGVVDGHLELLLADGNAWLPDTEQDHLLKLQEKLNNYIHFIESKQYVESYGDNFEKKVINITFQYSPSDNGFAFLVQVQKVLQPTDIRLKVVVPE